MKTFMETLRNNKKLLVAVIIAILVQVFTFACMGNTYCYSASDIATQICKLIALLLVMSSFIFNINKKSKPAIACAVASAFVVMIGYLLSCYLVYLNYRDTLVWRYFFDWSYLLEILLSILPQVMLLVFLLKKPKNVKPWAWVAVFLSFLPSLINLLLDWEYWWYTVHDYYESIILALCYDISLALLYYFGYTAGNDTAQQSGEAKKVTASMYTNIGGKIKMLAKIVCFLGIIGSLIYGICFFATYYWMRGIGIVIMLGGSLLSWIGSFFTYGFGELIEKTAVIAEAAAKADVKKDTVE